MATGTTQKSKSKKISIRPNVMDRNLRLAKRISERNGGKLPNPWALIQLDYGSLYRYIKRHPKEFAHFKVDVAVGHKKNGTFNVSIRRKHLITAQQLAKSHGVIPPPRWLNSHGYSRLASYMRVYPEVFAKVCA